MSLRFSECETSDKMLIEEMLTADTICGKSGHITDIYKIFTVPACPLNFLRMLPVATSHSMTVLSIPHEQS